MVDKIVYNSLQALLEEQMPERLPLYQQYLSENMSSSLVVAESWEMKKASEYFASTEMYKFSNVIKKMQKLKYNILTIWPQKTKALSKEPKDLL